MYMKELIAKILFKLGFRLNFSTGIDGNLTSGYGKLDDYGYWEYPFYIKKIK